MTKKTQFLHDFYVMRPLFWLSTFHFPICLSRVWLQTELHDTKSYYQLIIKITISEKKKNSQVKKNRRKLAVKYWQRRCKHSKGYRQKHKSVRTRIRNYNFECDSFIKTTSLNVISWLNCPITNCPITNYPIANCPITTWQANQWKIGFF